MSTAWVCNQCGWEGYGPSLTDASELRLTANGDYQMDRTHQALCPRCFSPAQTARARAAEELRRAIIGITLVQ